MSSRFFVSLIHPAANGVYRALRDAVPLAIDDAWGSLARAAEGEAMIFACRHGQLLPLLWATEQLKLTIVVSRSRDGEMLARILGANGFDCIRGSSSSGGKLAGRQALRTLRSGARLGVAVDGPRGPRGCVQEGLLRIARRADVPIVPLQVQGGRPWVFTRSWDRFELPRPYQPIRIEVSSPVRVEAGDEGLARAGDQVARSLGGWWDHRRVPSTIEDIRGEAEPSYGHS